MKLGKVIARDVESKCEFLTAAMGTTNDKLSALIEIDSANFLLDVDEEANFRVTLVSFVDIDNNELIVLDSDTHDELMEEVYFWAEDIANNIVDQYNQENLR